MSAPRMPTGVAGLDETLGGGIPRGHITLVVGGPGSGKTLLAVQSLAHGVRLGEPAVFVTFEESADAVRSDVASFEWSAATSGRRFSVIDARSARTAVGNGEFDLIGLLSAVGHRCARTKARRLAFDGIDVLLDLIDDPAVVRRELYRLAGWISEQDLTTFITTKHLSQGAVPSRYEFLPFLTDCVIHLEHGLDGRTAARGLRVLKCRGVAHSSNLLPLVFSPDGIDVLAPRTREMRHKVLKERLSTGVGRLDSMLEGGYLRGTCTLVSGAPGTAKSSLAGAFAEAACGRGERVLLVSFDEAAAAIVRNLESVRVRLGPHVRSGLLRMSSMSPTGTPPEAHAVRIAALLDRHRATCLVVDPASALMHSGAPGFATEAMTGLLDAAKSRGVTVVMTSLLEGADQEVESTAIGLSTIADTWMHLSYVVHAGERNRALTIVKSRGTGHSSQVRELVLSRDGISIVDVYTAGGAVLMGTLRWEREEQERAARAQAARAGEARREELAAALAATEGQVAGLRDAARRHKAELRRLAVDARRTRAEQAASLTAVRALRRADAAPDATRRPGRSR